MVTAVAKPEEKLSTWLSKDAIRNRIGNAIGKSFDPDFFVEQILIALQNPLLSECTPDSMFKAAHTCAALGMLPTLGHVALIPYKNKGVGEECTVMPQWQGMQAIMMRHPEILDISHSLVHPADRFEFDGTTSKVRCHEYDPFDETRTFKDIEDVRGGYLVISFRDSSRPKKYHMVSAEKIKQARGCAKSNKFWGPWFEEQCIKTLYRNGFARRVIPIDPMLNQQQMQATLEQEDDINENSTAQAQPDVKVLPQRAASRTEALAGRLAPPKEEPPKEEPSPFDSLKASILKADSMDKLEALHAEMQADAEALTEGQIKELQQLIDDGAAALG